MNDKTRTAEALELRLEDDPQPSDKPLQHVASPSSATPAQLLAIAVQRGDDLDKLEKLMDLQDRWEAKQARRAFDAALAGAKGEIKPIIKNRLVDFANRNAGGRTRYEYEDLAAIAEHVDPILSRHGLTYRHRPRQQGTTLFVTCILSHVDGHSEETELNAPYDTSGNKNPAQAIASTGTFLQRYTLKMALGLSATGDDDDGQGSGDEDAARLSAAQIKELEGMLKEYGVNLDRFLAYGRISNLAEIRAANFEAVKAEIVARKGGNGGKGGTKPPQRKSEQHQAYTLAELLKDADRAGVSEKGVLRHLDLAALTDITTEHLASARDWIRSLHP